MSLHSRSPSHPGSSYTQYSSAAEHFCATRQITIIAPTSCCSRICEEGFDFRPRIPYLRPRVRLCLAQFVADIGAWFRGRCDCLHSSIQIALEVASASPQILLCKSKQTNCYTGLHLAANQQTNMPSKFLSFLNLFLAITLFFSLTMAQPVRVSGRMPARPQSEPKMDTQSNYGGGRLHARSFNREFKRTPAPEPSSDLEGNLFIERAPAVENSLRGNTKVYSGNYWKRKTYHV